MTKDPLKIRELRVRAVKVPMVHPHRTASGTITESPLVLTDVLTEEGVVGHSYVFCYAALALKPVALLVKGLEPLVAGQPVAPLEIEQVLARRFRLLGPQGLTGIAMAAVDMALWDAGRLRGRWTSADEFLEDETRVRAAEAEGIGQRPVERRVFRFPHEAERAGGIRRFDGTGWWTPLLA